MVLKMISEEKDGHIVHRRYLCPCGKGYIKEEQDYTPGIEMLLYPLNAKLVKNTTKLTMEVAARLGDYIVTIQLIIIIRALS